jgi:hypothetical protein
MMTRDLCWLVTERYYHAADREIEGGLRRCSVIELKASLNTHGKLERRGSGPNVGRG